MSLVGPRPHAVAHDEYYGARIPNYAVRFKVKPGITGWAQVNGARGETPTLDDHAGPHQLRRLVCGNASLALDLKILARDAAGSSCARRNAVLMHALAHKLPFAFEAPQTPALAAANESYGEVTVGGLTTACLSRDGLAR